MFLAQSEHGLATAVQPSELQDGTVQVDENTCIHLVGSDTGTRIHYAEHTGTHAEQIYCNQHPRQQTMLASPQRFASDAAAPTHPSVADYGDLSSPVTPQLTTDAD